MTLITTAVLALALAAASAQGQFNKTAEPKLLLGRSGGGGSRRMCPDLKDGAQANGTPVQIWDCDARNPNQLWRTDEDQIRLVANPSLCIDAGSNPHDGSRVKVWQCYPGLVQQTWVDFSSRSGPKKQLKGTNLCLDVTNGNWVNGQQLQVWTCNFGNVNQVFFEAPAAEYIRTNQS